MTHIRVTCYVECPFSAALELAQKAIKRREHFYLTPSPPLGERVDFAVTCKDDCTDDARKHEALLVAWRPQNSGLFPEFSGVLTVRPKRRGVLLRLSGRYEPPMGLAGKFFDLFVGRTIARRTMHNFLNGLAADIEDEYRLERSATKSA